MEHSDTIIELAKALSKFQGAISSVVKGSENPYFHAKYADLDAVWEMCRKPLTDNGFALVQMTVEADGKWYLETQLLHMSGEYISSRYPLTPMKQTKDQGWVLSNDPQSIGSAITYARRYAMSAILGISADEDDDAEKSMGREERTASRRTRVLPPPQASVRLETPPDDASCPRHPGERWTLIQHFVDGVKATTWSHIIQGETGPKGGRRFCEMSAVLADAALKRTKGVLDTAIADAEDSSQDDPDGPSEAEAVSQDPEANVSRYAVIEEQKGKLIYWLEKRKLKLVDVLKEMGLESIDDIKTMEQVREVKGVAERRIASREEKP